MPMQARRCTCLSSEAVHALLVLLEGGNGGAVMMPAAASLRYLALAPGAAEVMAGKCLDLYCLILLHHDAPSSTVERAANAAYDCL